MKADAVRKKAFSMPLNCPSYPPGPYRFVDREYLIITYRTDRAALEKVVPKPLEIVDPVVKYEFIRMPNSTGFGDYSESGQVISVLLFDGRRWAAMCAAMFLDDDPPIAGGRELWGFREEARLPDLAGRARHPASAPSTTARPGSLPAAWATSTGRSTRDAVDACDGASRASS